jgi:glycosyltransferase involved in cell wall biosynthesis
MRIALVTEAWLPQVNGVVRTWRHMQREARALGHELRPFHPGLFGSLPLPRYPEVRLSVLPGRKLARLLDEFSPQAIHIATEGPLGWAGRRYCLDRGRPFTTSYHTQFAPYLRMYFGIPQSLTHQWLRRFHAPAQRTLVPTASVRRELTAHGFAHLEVWGRGVDADLFRPPECAPLDSVPGATPLPSRETSGEGSSSLSPAFGLTPSPAASPADGNVGVDGVRASSPTLGVSSAPAAAEPLDLSRLPRPIFLTAGRVAREKNVEAFARLDLPGSKVVIGEGPARAALSRQYPGVHWVGYLADAELARGYAAADVFVFPSRTDTFGNVMQEANACGVPVAAYPVTGPIDVVRPGVTGVLHEDLRTACLEALKLDRAACRAFALTRSWRHCATELLAHLAPIETGGESKVQRPVSGDGFPVNAIPESADVLANQSTGR